MIPPCFDNRGIDKLRFTDPWPLHVYPYLVYYPLTHSPINPSSQQQQLAIAADTVNDPDHISLHSTAFDGPVSEMTKRCDDDDDDGDDGDSQWLS